MSNANDFVIENGVLTKYVGSGGDVVIPDEVTVIGDGVFNSNQSIKGITISANVRQIDAYAFHECKKLKKLRFEEGLETIHEGAFYHCVGLKHIIIPSSVRKIGKCAFQRCIHLEKVIILGIPEIGKDAFERTEAVFLLCKLPLNKVSSRKIKYNALLGWFMKTDSDPEVDGTVEKSLRQYKKKVFEQMIPDIQNNRIALDSLLERKLIDYEETNSLIDALQGNVEKTAALLNYRQENFSDSVIEAKENQAVKRGLRAPTVAEIKKLWATRVLDDGTNELITYKGNDIVVMVPDVLGKKSISTIGMDCFAVVPTYGDNARDVENMDIRRAICSVILPYGIKNIGYCAFKDNESLSKIVIPDSVCQINYCAFYECPNLTTHAPAGSYAEQYAKEHNIPFVAE